ncbi:MAG: hypothetical protein N2385_12220 [Chloroflexus sp.]|nr:hypothetical protein [Chloroflexus sp.]
MRFRKFGCLLCILGFLTILPPVEQAQIWSHLAALTQSYRLPTAIIRDVIAAVERNDPPELAAFAAQMDRPASLNWLIAAWHQVHHPPTIALGPYRAPDWPMLGMQIAIPLRLSCHHHAVRLDVIVAFTTLGWQIREIRPPA